MASAPVIELPYGITCIDTLQIRPQLAACYLIQQRDAVALVETGTGRSVGLILAALASKDIPRRAVRYIMPTHVHLDHASGAGHLMEELDNAELVVHPRGARHLADPAKLWAGAAAVYGAARLERMYGEMRPVDPSRMIIATDGLQLDLDGRPLRFIDTPGHARHHYSIYDDASRGFFTGDTFGMAYLELRGARGPYIMPTTTPVQFDPDAWHQTLDRYLGFAPQRMFLTHYSMVEDVARLAGDLRRRIDQHAAVALQLQHAPDRVASIGARLAQLTLHELADWDCVTAPAELPQLLELDFQLNAQGLDAWLTTLE